MINKLIEEKIINKQQIKIELGCGNSKHAGYIGIDALALENVDITTDIEDGLHFIPDNSIDEVYSSHFLEHLDNFEMIINEIYRILKPNKVFVPHFSNPYFYSDPTHKRFFGLYTFDYYSETSALKRKVPPFYEGKNKFIITKRKLIFKSPFKSRNLIKILFQKTINSSNFLLEFYEENLCYIFPCQEIYYEMTVIK